MAMLPVKLESRGSRVYVSGPTPNMKACEPVLRRMGAHFDESGVWFGAAKRAAMEAELAKVRGSSSGSERVGDEELVLGEAEYRSASGRVGRYLVLAFGQNGARVLLAWTSGERKFWVDTAKCTMHIYETPMTFEDWQALDDDARALEHEEHP